MKEALLQYIRADGIAHGLDMHTAAKAAFLDRLESHLLGPRNLDYRVQFTGPTGTNAVEAALKLARTVTGRRNVIAFTNGFHGVSQGALAATGNGFNRMAPALSLPDVTRVPYDGYLGPDIDTADVLAQLLADPSSGVDRPAAILLELVQGEGGLNVASPAWCRKIAQIAAAYDALLIVDDVQAGCGRTGVFFSFEESGIHPDMVTLAKSLSGFGLPLAAVLIKPEYDRWQPGQHNGTFRGNNHAFITGRVALEKYWANNAFVERLAHKSAKLSARLDDIAARTTGARRKGRGFMQGVDLGSGDLAAAVVRRCFEAGLVIETAGPRDEVVKVLAPLTIANADLDAGLDILDRAVAESVVAPRRTVAA